MTSHVPGFDEWLSGALEKEALAVGESVDTFIRRAVAARLVEEHVRRGGSDLRELTIRIADAGPADAPPDTSPAAPLSDPDRLRALYETGLLDAGPDAAYDRIVAMAAEALDVPTAALSLVDHDRQFLFSSYGTTGELAKSRQTTIEQSVCRYVVDSGEPLIVEDARLHPVLKDHPTVVAKALLSYAGMPLTNRDDQTIGTLCVWDAQPRQWSSGHVQILHDLAELLRGRIFGSLD